jgi:hypothetical protein
MTANKTLNYIRDFSGGFREGVAGETDDEKSKERIEKLVLKITLFA